MKAQALVDALLASRGFLHKRDISDVVTSLSKSLPNGVSDLSQAVAVGDDCAAIADGDGYLLFAIEGFVEDFIQRMPWFAGYCGVMVNVSDIYAMGGRPIAVVDALWSRGMQPADEMLEGLATASQRYAVPIVGGHSNNRSERGQLAVAILGRAKELLSSFTARPGDELVMVVDLRGEYQEPYPYWNASTQAPAERLRGDLELLPMLAESGLCDTAKDISMAGAIGTTLMMLDCSKIGATIRIDDVPRPTGITTDEALLRWLTAFPSYGFVLSVRPANTASVLRHFQQRGLAAANIGNVTANTQVILQHQVETAVLWNTGTQAFITVQPAASAPEQPKARLAYA